MANLHVQVFVSSIPNKPELRIFIVDSSDRRAKVMWTFFAQDSKARTRYELLEFTYSLIDAHVTPRQMTNKPSGGK
ncbi:hypothetical protein [Roseateles sp. PN1]|uniref:hypothetical protein n=1 Tax=Roseateles sp. PN1 TaxID=3137372 RepID=UPI00313871A4